MALFYLSTLFVLVATYVIAVVHYISKLLQTPPHYIHRDKSLGLAQKGSIIDPIWGEKIHDPKRDYNLDFLEVEFPSHFSQPLPIPSLRGWHIPSKKSNQPKIGFLTVHGGGRDRREFHRFEPFIHRAGFEMLLFDYREHGISDGSGRGMDWGHSSYYDVLGAAYYAKNTLKWDKVILIGVSNGAVLSILASAHDSEFLIDGLIAESPYMSLRDGVGDILEMTMENWPRGVRYFSLIPFLIPMVSYALAFRIGGLKISSTSISMIDKIQPRPVLLIHGTADNRFKIRHTEELFKRLTHSAKEIWIVKGGKHTEVYDHCPADYEKKVINFANTYFRNEEKVNSSSASC